MKYNKKQVVKNFFAGLLKQIDKKNYVAADLLSAEYHKELASTSYISARGMLNRCDIHNSYQKSDNKALDIVIPPGETETGLKTVFVNTDSLEEFARVHLPLIRFQFTLVSGDSDRMVGAGDVGDKLIKSIVESPYLVEWFAQNLVVVYPKMSHLPIGLDFHNIWEKPGKYERGRTGPLLHELRIKEILAGSIPSSDRIFKAYCNWHFQLNRGDRKACYEKIDRSICSFEEKPVSRFNNYEQQSKHCFVLSPAGIGIDCYRTWEALVLGCIPIVKRNAITPLFDGLPVIVVEDWLDVNENLLVHEYARIRREKFDYSKLHLDYWVGRLKGLAVAGNGLTPDEYVNEAKRSYLFSRTGERGI